MNKEMLLQTDTSAIVIPSAVMTSAEIMNPSAVMNSAEIMNPSAVMNSAEIMIPSAVMNSAEIMIPSAVMNSADSKNQIQTQTPQASKPRKNIQDIHKRAFVISQKYKNAEIELIEILQDVDNHKVYYHYQFSSLFQYATNYLKLSEEVAYIYINVARKSKEVPALKEEIKKGNITVSKARRMTAVITNENQDHWLNLARTCSKIKLEKEVALCSPKSAEREKLAYAHPSQEIQEKVKVQRLIGRLSTPDLSSAQAVRVQLQVGVSEKLMLKIRRAQDVLGQQRRRPVSLEQVLETAIAQYLSKNDPLEKAKRQEMKGTLNQLCPGTVMNASASEIKSTACHRDAPPLSQHSQTRPEIARLTQPTTNHHHDGIALRRRPLAAKIKHKIWFESQGQCTHTDDQSQRCIQKRFLQIHHIKPVSAGGKNNLENLKMLCSGHHKAEHLNE